MEPSEIVLKIESSYGGFPNGIYLDTQAQEWESDYFSPMTIEMIFGSEEVYKASVQCGFLYLSSSLAPYEEVAVIECYTSDKARLIAALFLERDRQLSFLEETQLKAYVECHGRYVLYYRLADGKRAKKAVRSLDWS